MAMPDDWKGKYRELAEDFEKLERTSIQSSESMRLVINSLMIASKGNTPQLDEQLNQLKLLLHPETGDLGKLKKLSKLLDKEIRGADQIREKTAKSLLSALLAWVQSLRQHLQDDQQHENLRLVERQLHDAVEKLYQLPPLVQELVTFQQGVSQHKVEKKAEGASESFSLEGGSIGDLDTELLLQRVGTELIDLLSGLYLPKSVAETGHTLMQRIEKGFVLEELPELLHDVLSLVTLISSHASEDFERYLLELSAQLSEVQTFLVDSKQQQSATSDSHRHLDMQMRSDVRRLHETVKTSTDLLDLKKAVATQLVGIVRSMDQFRKTEEEREQRMQKRFDDLMEKVEQMEDESRQVQAHMEAEKIRALTDPLTGLPNRAAYDEFLNNEIERWDRYSTPFSMMVADIDRFKNVNDTFGHLAGDKVLRLISRVLRKNLRTTDFIARFGGEEFVVIMPSTQLDEAVLCAEKLRHAVEESPFNFHGKPVTITLSFGVAQITKGDESETLFALADERLYKAKDQGRNQVVSS